MPKGGERWEVVLGQRLEEIELSGLLSQAYCWEDMRTLGAGVGGNEVRAKDMRI